MTTIDKVYCCISSHVEGITRQQLRDLLALSDVQIDHAIDGIRKHKRKGRCIRIGSWLPPKQAGRQPIALWIVGGEPDAEPLYKDPHYPTDEVRSLAKQVCDFISSVPEGASIGDIANGMNVSICKVQGVIEKIVASGEPECLFVAGYRPRKSHHGGRPVKIYMVMPVPELPVEDVSDVLVVDPWKRAAAFVASGKMPAADDSTMLAIMTRFLVIKDEIMDML